MRIIQLTRGQVALIDDEDYELVSQYKWHIKRGRNGNFYARTTINYYKNGKHTVKILLMHQLITGYKQTDHKDGNGLNNQKDNLRPATTSQNTANMRKRARCSSKYKGVSYHKKSGKWQATISYDNTQIYLGLFDIEEEASLAYMTRAREVFGEFARAM